MFMPFQSWPRRSATARARPSAPSGHRIVNTRHDRHYRGGQCRHHQNRWKNFDRFSSGGNPGANALHEADEREAEVTSGAASCEFRCYPRAPQHQRYQRGEAPTCRRPSSASPRPRGERQRHECIRLSCERWCRQRDRSGCVPPSQKERDPGQCHTERKWFGRKEVTRNEHVRRARWDRLARRGQGRARFVPVMDWSSRRAEATYVRRPLV